MPGKGAKPYLPQKPYDLTGTWQYETQRGPVGRIQIKQNGGLVYMWGAFGGFPNFAGWYTRNPVIGGTGLSKASTQNDLRWGATTVFIDSPDLIRINSEGKTLGLFRISPPAANDVACDGANSNHVTSRYAWVRGQVAIENKNMTAARCWATVSVNEGYPGGQSLLAALLIQSEPPDYGSAFKLASASAGKGDIAGMLILASMYREGKGTAADPAKAKQWEDQAARSAELKKWQNLNQQSKDMFGMSLGQVTKIAMDMADAVVKDIDRNAAEFECALKGPRPGNDCREPQ